MSREQSNPSNTPLMFALALSVMLHALILPLAFRPWSLADSERVLARRPKLDKPLPQLEHVKLGAGDTIISTVAWIPYDDYQELLAPESTTEQPAVQQEVEPDPNAPYELNPTPPANPAAPSQPQPMMTENAPTQPAPLAPRQAPFDPSPTADDAELASAQQIGEPRDGPESAESARPVEPKEQTEPQPPGGPVSPAEPTVAPRDDREAPPTRVFHDDPVRPGRVITAQGIEIKTVKPDISMIARASTVARNPVADVTFDTDGRVIEVLLKRSTGADNYDGPIVSSLYKWRATGEKLEELNRPFVCEFSILIGGE